MKVYVWTGDYRSYGSSQDLWGGNTIEVEVPDDFIGGGKTYDPVAKVWITDPPHVPTHEDYVHEAENERQRRIDEANAIMADWVIDLQLGMISDEDKAKLILWRQYVKDVKATSTENAPDVNWPPKPQN